MRRYVAVSLLISLLLFPSVSCKQDTERREITFPPTNVLTVQSSWGVVTSSHLRLRAKPTTDSRAVTTLWRGNILEILSKTNQEETVENELGYWYQVTYEGLSGWVFGAYLDIYRSRKMAQEASEELE